VVVKQSYIPVPLHSGLLLALCSIMELCSNQELPERCQDGFWSYCYCLMVRIIFLRIIVLWQTAYELHV
jgi:hypothetical protein